MDTSALLSQSFSFYQESAKLIDVSGNARDCLAVIWSSELGLGRNVSMPVQNDGHNEQKVSHFAIVSLKPLDSEERLEAIHNHIPSRFRLESTPVPAGTFAPSFWILKLNEEAIP